MQALHVYEAVMNPIIRSYTVNTIPPLNYI